MQFQLALLVSCNTSVRKVNSFRMISGRRGRETDLIARGQPHQCLFALIFVREHPSVALAEGRRPDRRDEAARATLVSSPEHHPSSWELSG